MAGGVSKGEVVEEEVRQLTDWSGDVLAGFVGS